jgi:hypothetical protein
VLIKLTLAGDANLNGTVDFNDLFAVGEHLNTTGNDWAQGNFNYSPNGVVDFNDLFLLGQNLNQTLVLPPSVQTQNTDAVPEPASLGFASVCAFSLLPRRRRR